MSLSSIKRRLVASTSGGDIEQQIKRIKAPDNMTLALGNQSGTGVGIAAADFKIVNVVRGSLDSQTDLADVSKYQSVKSTFVDIKDDHNKLVERVESLEGGYSNLESKAQTQAGQLDLTATAISGLTDRVAAAELSILQAPGSSTFADLQSAISNITDNVLPYMPKTIRFQLAPTSLLCNVTGTSSGALAQEKQHYFTPVVLVPGRSYQIHFGYNGLDNHYSALPGFVTTGSTPHKEATGAMCRRYYLICRVHRGTTFNNTANTYANLSISRSSSSATFYNANEAVTAVFRTSTTPPVYTAGVTPEGSGNDNTYTIGFYVRNETFTGGTGADAPALLKFESIWYRLEEQPGAPP